MSLLDASNATSHCYSAAGQIAFDVFSCGQVCPKCILDRATVEPKREVANGLQGDLFAFTDTIKMLNESHAIELFPWVFSAPGASRKEQI